MCPVGLKGDTPAPGCMRRCKARWIVFHRQTDRRHFASGKSTAGKILRVNWGGGRHDADEVARDVVLPASRPIAKIVEAFGKGILIDLCDGNQAANRRLITQKLAAPGVSTRRI